MRKLSNAVSSFKFGKAGGDDDIPAEFWKALVDDGKNEASSSILSFCNQVWSMKTVPHQWHVARIAAIFNKKETWVIA